MRHILLFLLCCTFLSCLYAQDNQELKKMYEEDQSSRKVEKIDWKNLLKQDSTRRVEVLEMIRQNKVMTPMDYYYAAMIFQHGSDSSSYKLAWDYSKKASSMDSTNIKARWLSAASYDRYLLSIGQPQVYGTQFIIVDKKYYLRDFDTTKVTDKERINYKVGSLKSIREYLTSQNGEDKGLLIYPKSNKIITK